MNTIRILSGAAIVAILSFGAAGAAEQNTSTSEKMNPQPAPAAAAKSPAGVTDPNAVEKKTQGMTGAQTGCKTASAEMTNGKVEDCKQ